MWLADVHVRPAGGVEVERFRVTAPPSVRTRSGAERWALDVAQRIAVEGRPRNTKRAREEVAEREAVARAAHVPTLGEFWPTFVAHLHAERRKGNTIASYVATGERRVLPLLAGRRLDTIGPADVLALKASMQASAAASVNIALSVLAQVLKVAATHHPAIVPPPMRRVRSTAGAHLRFYDRAQAAALVRAVADRPDRLAAILLALDAGLRRNEVHALRWCDVDLEAGEIHVRHSLYRGRLQTPKSGKARRVAITRRLVAALSDLRRVDEWVLPRSAQTKPGGLRANAPVDLGSVLAGAARRAGVPNHGAHSLRHTFACFALAAGGDLQAVQRMLGHSSIAVTAAYAHMLPGAAEEVAARLEAFATAPGVTGTFLTNGPKPLRSPPDPLH